MCFETKVGYINSFYRKIYFKYLYYVVGWILNIGSMLFIRLINYYFFIGVYIFNISII